MAKIRVSTRGKYRLDMAKANSIIKNSRAFRAELRSEVQKLFSRSKMQMLTDFDEHPVTRELRDGPNASNKSNTLSGGYGNLFSFIGFHRNGPSPVQVIRTMLESSGIKRIRVHGASTKSIRATVHTTVPSQEEIYGNTPMPWGPGSWAEGIESGIDGFSNYINARWFSSRSGKGVQVPHTVRSTSFSPVQYLSQIYRDFERRIDKL